jgi:hypothetical protein
MFEGFPLQGAVLRNCVFIFCEGQIGEHMHCRNIFGLGLKGHAEQMALKNKTEAKQLLDLVSMR